MRYSASSPPFSSLVSVSDSGFRCSSSVTFANDTLRRPLSVPLFFICQEAAFPFPPGRIPVTSKLLAAGPPPPTVRFSVPAAYVLSTPFNTPRYAIAPAETIARTRPRIRTFRKVLL